VLVEIEVCEQFSYNSRSESAGHLCSAELLAVPESWHVHFRRPQFLGRHMLWLGKLQDNTETPAVRLPAQPHHNNVGRHEQRAPCPSTTTAMIAASPPPARALLLGTALPLRPVLVLVEPS
jgi:hypothetical protein